MSRMRKREVVLGFVAATLLVQGSLQHAAVGQPLVRCFVTFCNTEHGLDVEGCFTPEEFVDGDESMGGSAGADACKTAKSFLPCAEIPECAAREAPALGITALLLTALGLGAGGTILRRRKARR